MNFFPPPRYRGTADEADNPYWMSFSDIMAGLLVIFILVCATLLLRLTQMENKVSQNINELKQASRARSEILNEIVVELKRQNIRVEISDNDSVLRIPEQAFHFDTGSYEIKPEHRETAKRIGQVLYYSITKDERWKYLETVFVEGHTDSRNARSYKMGNWELSAMRAISLWKFWIENTSYGVKLKGLRNRQKKLLFSVSGYSSTRRVVEKEDSREAMRKNRRIDIRFTTRQPSLMELRKVSEPLKGKEL
ncbi:OmpA family protein [Desulforhopalus vacuolatus]|uniref:OmpA/MotB family protein n=1 Tax=Desulforhopalus vacuolatus TaxID=40414 RepID=UPI00196434F6|nr:OmpA family protein [Desulforhopalus vacuolatus]MBM9520103.1 OmpA family protein [Desulforhopalus vacuolatus]